MNTEIICILDRSGSMPGMINESVGGFNAFIEQQKKEPGEARVTTLIFDSQLEYLFTAKPLKNVEPLTRDQIRPRGTTALYEAVGRTIYEQHSRIADEGWADRVLVCILTDGANNNHHPEYTQARAAELITEYSEQDWKFVFLGANIDVASVSAGMGMNSRNSVAVAYGGTGAGMTKAYAMMNSTVTTFRNGTDAPFQQKVEAVDFDIPITQVTATDTVNSDVTAMEA
jgi:uncharacterized protein YegL